MYFHFKRIVVLSVSFLWWFCLQEDRWPLWMERTSTTEEVHSTREDWWPVLVWIIWLCWRSFQSSTLTITERDKHWAISSEHHRPVGFYLWMDVNYSNMHLPTWRGVHHRVKTLTVDIIHVFFSHAEDNRTGMWDWNGKKAAKHGVKLSRPWNNGRLMFEALQEVLNFLFAFVQNNSSHCLNSNPSAMSLKNYW